VRPWLLALAGAAVVVTAASALAKPADKGMTRERFWKVVEAARPAKSTDEEFIHRLTSSLAASSAEEVAAFSRHFDELHGRSYSYALWGACYLARGGCSDDSFEYFRAWLIGQGRAVFQQAARNPDSLAALPRVGELEELLGLAREVYQQKTGKELVFTPHHPPKPLGTDWDFENRSEMKRRYPRLFARYGSSPSR